MSSALVEAMEPPSVAKEVFEKTKFGWIWLLVRVYVSYVWISAGWAKLANPAWTETGVALKGYWINAVKVPDPEHPVIAYDWYRSFIQFLLDGGHYVWFGKLIAFGELFVGIALFLGIFTGLFAFFAAFMNWNYIMAGTASINGALLVLAVLLMAAWRIAGWWGVDRWLLPWFGTPWQASGLFRKK